MRAAFRFGLLTILSFRILCGATLITEPFSPTVVMFPNFPPTGGISLPYTDPFGDMLFGEGFIANTPGELFTFLPIPLDISFGSPVTKFGLTVGHHGGDVLVSLSSATLSNGDSFNAVVPLTPGTFFGLSSETPFTAVTLNFTGRPSSPDFTDFRFAAVPEPSALWPLAFLLGVPVAFWRRSKGAMTLDSSLSGKPDGR